MDFSRNKTSTGTHKSSKSIRDGEQPSREGLPASSKQSHFSGNSNVELPPDSALAVVQRVAQRVLNKTETCPQPQGQETSYPTTVSTGIELNPRRSKHKRTGSIEEPSEQNLTIKRSRSNFSIIAQKEQEVPSVPLSTVEAFSRYQETPKTPQEIPLDESIEKDKQMRQLDQQEKKQKQLIYDIGALDGKASNGRVRLMVKRLILYYQTKLEDTPEYEKNKDDWEEKRSLSIEALQELKGKERNISIDQILKIDEELKVLSPKRYENSKEKLKEKKELPYTTRDATRERIVEWLENVEK